MTAVIINIFSEFLKAHPEFIALNFLFMFLLPINEIYVSTLFGKLFSAVQMGKNIANNFVIILITIAILQVVFCVSDYFSAIQSLKFQQFFKITFLKKIIERYEFTGKEPNLSDSMTKIQKTHQIVNEWLTKMFGFFIPISIQLVLSILYFMYIDIRIGLALLTTIVVFGIFMSYGQNSCDANESNMNLELTKINDRIGDIIQNHDSVFKEQSFDMEAKNIENMYNTYGTLYQSTSLCGMRYRLCLSFTIVLFFSYFSYRSYNLLRMNKLVHAMFYTQLIIISNLISNMIYMINLHRDLIFDQIHIQNSGLKDVYKLENDTDCVETPDMKAILEIKNLSYIYPNKVMPTLLDVNIRLLPNERVIIVGEIGSGKSTLLKIIQRLYKPRSGSVFLRRKCINSYTVKELYSTLGYMPQNALLFNRTILENIKYESPETSNETIVELMKRFGILKHFPNGLDINANNLSGGQRQMVWFVRLYLKNASVLLFDEPTASLDMESKKLFIDMINGMFKDKTILIISHDPYIINQFDRVLDMKKINSAIK
jgi:ABC-type multidrug transport system fused ATPase/permease subunit